jgi:hypothetical protein
VVRLSNLETVTFDESAFGERRFCIYMFLLNISKPVSRLNSLNTVTSVPVEPFMVRQAHHERFEGLDRTTERQNRKMIRLAEATRCQRRICTSPSAFRLRGMNPRIGANNPAVCAEPVEAPAPQNHRPQRT